MNKSESKKLIPQEGTCTSGESLPDAAVSAVTSGCPSYSGGDNNDLPSLLGSMPAPVAGSATSSETNRDTNAWQTVPGRFIARPKWAGSAARKATPARVEQQKHIQPHRATTTGATQPYGLQSAANKQPQGKTLKRGKRGGQPPFWVRKRLQKGKGGEGPGGAPPQGPIVGRATTSGATPKVRLPPTPASATGPAGVAPRNRPHAVASTPRPVTVPGPSRAPRAAPVKRGRADATLSPVEANKRPCTNRGEDRSRSYAEAAQSHLHVAIATSPPTNITHEQASKLVLALERVSADALLASRRAGPGNLALRFLGKPILSEGVLKVWCGNDVTLAWLRDTVASMPAVIGRELTVIKQSDIAKTVKAGMLLPTTTVTELGEVFDILIEQNPEYNIGRWKLHRYELQEGKGLFLILGIPEEELPGLLAGQRRVSYLLGSVYVRFFTPTGLSDSPHVPHVGGGVESTPQGGHSGSDETDGTAPAAEAPQMPAVVVKTEAEWSERTRLPWLPTIADLALSSVGSSDPNSLSEDEDSLLRLGEDLFQ